MRDARTCRRDPAAKDIFGNPLLVREAMIVTVGQYVATNQCPNGHARRVPPGSNRGCWRGRSACLSGVPVGEWSRRRIDAGAPLYQVLPPVGLPWQVPHVYSRQPLRNGCRRRAGCRNARRVLWARSEFASDLGQVLTLPRIASLLVAIVASSTGADRMPMMIDRTRPTG